MRGFILTITANLDRADIWFKNISGKVERINIPYHPDFYVKPENTSLDELWTSLSNHPNIVNLTPERKRLSLSSIGMSEVIHVYVDSIASYRGVLSDVSRFPCKVYNSDLAHRQKILFKLGVPCWSLVDYDGDGKFILLENSFTLSPPPLNPLFFKVYASSSGLKPSPRVDPIVGIAVHVGGEGFILEGDECEIMKDFCSFIRDFDPDLMITSDLEFTVKYLRVRASINGLELNFSRVSSLDFRGPLTFNGRVLIDLADYESWGLAGLAELCYYSMLTPELAAHWPVGRLVDSRQCYEAFKRDVLLPVARSHSAFFRSLGLLHRADRGGLTFNPHPGIYQNVCQLDFDSQYPHIIVRYNVSYETVSDLGEILSSRRGFLAEITEPWLRRRLYFKRLARTLPGDDPRRIYADERQKALKALLVVVYGYSGCIWNRFANVKCFEEINNISRRVLVKAMHLAEERGFKVIYADVDSLFVHRCDASLVDYEELCRVIAEETGLPISIENWFKFLVLLPQESNVHMGATKRYFGRLMSGELYFKGIEARRKDYPEYVKEVQVEMMDRLLRGASLDDVRTNIVGVLSVLERAFRDICERRVPIEKLILYNTIRRSLNEYSSMYPHVSAAHQIRNLGLKIDKGTLVGYVYIKSKHPNPLQRVQCLDLLDGRSYDKEKYVEMLLEAAETILSPFNLTKEDLRAQITSLSKRKHIQVNLRTYL